MSGEPMTLKFISKINVKLKFLYRENRYLTKKSFADYSDYARPARQPNLNEKTKKKIKWIKVIKIVNSWNTSKHKVKKHYLTWIISMYVCTCASACIYVCVPVGVCIYTYGYILVCFPLTHPFSYFFSRLSFSLIFVLT